MNPEDFYTRPKSEAGVRLPLLRPDGTDSGEWLCIAGPDSDAYRQAMADLLRRTAELGESAGMADFEDRQKAILLDTRAALVIGWSFGKPASHEAVREFLANCPGVAADIEDVAADRSRFFGPASTPSTPTHQ